MQYYLSVDTVKGAGDTLLGGRAVPGLAANATSAVSLQLLVPTNTILGTYYLLACADDTHVVAETDEAGNCRASTTTMQVGRPDLTISAVGNPSTAVPGVAFQVSDTVQNQTAFSAGGSRTQYYLSVDAVRSTGDRLLSGMRAVPALAAGGASIGTASVVVPNGTPIGTYYFLACADDVRAVAERDETNNCRTSTTQILVGRPDLVITAVGDPPATAAGRQRPGVRDGAEPECVQRDRHLPGAVLPVGRRAQERRGPAAHRLPDGGGAGGRRVLAGDDLAGDPGRHSPGDYFLLVCADDTFLVIESDETNNCRASTAKLTVTP